MAWRAGEGPGNPVGDYQPTTGPGQMQVTVMEPTDAELGRGNWDVLPQHADARQPSTYDYQAEMDREAQPTETRLRWRSSGGPWSPRVPYQAAPETEEHQSYVPRWTGSSNVVATGSPGAGNLEPQLHSLNAGDVAALGVTQPHKRTGLLRWLLGERDEVDVLEIRAVPAMGRPSVDSPELYRGVGVAAGHNGWVVPNPRQSWDTPNAVGMPRDLAGHLDPGKAGRPTTSAANAPSPEDPANVRTVVDNGNGTPDTWTGQANRTMAGAADPRTMARPAQQVHYTFARPFDMLMAHRLSGGKGVYRSPSYATPVLTQEEQVGLRGEHAGSIGGRTSTTPAPGMTPVSGVSPNTDRQVPGAWDYDLVVLAQSGVDTLARRWGLR